VQAIKFDTLTYVKELTGAGVTYEVAEIHAMTVAHAFGMFIDGVVTKDYLDATLDARFAAQDAKFEKRFDAIDQRFLEFEMKFEQRFVDLEMKFEQRFGAIDQRFAAIDQRFVEQDLKSEKRFSAIETELGSVKTAIGSLNRQMYILMGGVFIPLVLKLGEFL
jgi:Zn-dependent oligopeptidase